MAHAVLVAVVLLGPGSWFSGAEEDAALDVMTLRLGGPEGPGEGGLTPLGSRPIQEVVPLQEARRPQWIQPPSPTPPEMILPVTEEESRRRPEPETEVETAPEEARGRTPTRGPEAREGLAMADTGATGLGTGLSAGGLGGIASELDVGDFCCPRYLATMIELIRQHWDNRQRVPGEVVVRFTNPAERRDRGRDRRPAQRVPRAGPERAPGSAAHAHVAAPSVAVSRGDIDRPPDLRVSAMTRSPGRIIPLVLAIPLAGTLLLAQQPSGDSRQRSEVDLTIGGRIGAQPRFAVPDCLALTSDRETAAAASTFAEVLWDDLEFEREFRMVPRDTYDSIPRARSLTEPPFDAWRELGADGVVTCTVRRVGDDRVEVDARLFNVRSFDSALGERYTGGLRGIRTYAHAFSDEIHRQQRGLRGVARSRLTFVSDRDSESVLGLVPDRQTKEVYIADYTTAPTSGGSPWAAP